MGVVVGGKEGEAYDEGGLGSGSSVSATSTEVESFGVVAGQAGTPIPQNDAVHPTPARAIDTDWDGFQRLSDILRQRANDTRTWSAVSLAATLLLVLLGVGTIVILPEYLKYRHVSSLLEKSDELGKKRVQRATLEYKLDGAKTELTRSALDPSVSKLADLMLAHYEAKKKYKIEEARAEQQCAERIAQRTREQHPAVTVTLEAGALALRVNNESTRIGLYCRVPDDPELSSLPIPPPSFGAEEIDATQKGPVPEKLQAALQTVRTLQRDFLHNPTKFIENSQATLEASRKAYADSAREMKAQAQLAKAMGGAGFAELSTLMEDADDEDAAAKSWAEGIVAKQKSHAAKTEEVAKLDSELKGLKEVEEKLNTSLAEQRLQDTSGAEFSYDGLANRVTAALLLVFLVQVLVAVHRYSHRLAAFYDARADTLAIASVSKSQFDSLRHIETFLSTDHLAFKDAPRSPLETLGRIVSGKQPSKKQPGKTAG